MSIEERVNAGAAWLDLNFPGWVDQIDLDGLDQTAPTACVLSRVSGQHYYTARRVLLNDSADEAARLGFDCNYGPEETARNSEFTSVWKAYIEKARTKPKDTAFRFTALVDIKGVEIKLRNVTVSELQDFVKANE